MASIILIDVNFTFMTNMMNIDPILRMLFVLISCSSLEFYSHF